MPPTAVAFADDVASSMAALLDRAVRHGGPSGGQSPHVRVVEAGEAELFVRGSATGHVAITDRDGDRLRAGLPADARRIVGELEHIARWRQVKQLHNPISRLRDAVSLELVEPLPGEAFLGRARTPVTPDGDGGFRLAYQFVGHRWTAPERFLQLRNHADRPLFCVVLDLNDRFGSHADLFRGAAVRAGAVAPVAQGRRVEFGLPAGRRVRPGAQVCDWLMVIVAEDEIAAAPFELPPVGETGHYRPTRGPVGLHGVVDRLGRAATWRDVGPAVPDAAADWWTVVVPVVTEVP